MGDEETRENMIRAAKELRAFYRNFTVSDETISRAIKADLSEPPEEHSAEKSEQEKSSS